MSDTSVADAQQHIQQGKAAALAGDTFAARTSFRRATELDPNNVEAWVGLSAAVPVLAEKRDYLQRALAIDPGYTEARVSLEYVEKLIGEGLQLAPSQRRAEQAASGNASPLLSAPEPSAPATDVAYCYIHPNRETGLHCVQCGRAICGECATPAAVGQLCPECRKARRPPNYQVSLVNAAVGGLIALVMGLIAVFALTLVVRLPFIGLFLGILAGPLVGEITVRIVERLTKKRGRPMQLAVGLGLVLGSLGLLLLSLLQPSLFTLVLVLFVVLAVSTAAARLR